MSYVIFSGIFFLTMLLHLSIRELNNDLLDFFHLLLMVEYNAYKIASILFHESEEV